MPTATPPPFEDIEVTTPEPEALEDQYGRWLERLAASQEPSEGLAVLEEWDAMRAELQTWASMAQLRFHQDITDEKWRAERERSDELTPKLEELDVRIKRALLTPPHRQALIERHGEHLVALWSADVTASSPVIEQDQVAINKLVAEYVELLAGAEIPFEGETYNLSGIGKFTSDADRATRHEASRARWGWVAEHGERFDRIFDELVALRHRAATRLGFSNYIDLGYAQMRRVDYDGEDVRQFRDEVRRVVQPLAQRLRDEQAERLEVDELKAWDLGVYDPQGNPAPQGEHDWLVERGQEMFDALGHGLGEFFAGMRERGYMDLKSRRHKSSGGFCTSFPTVGSPFIFAQFNGTKHDVKVFTHEMGHAFQNWMSRGLEPMDYLWPTYESAEIHSMSLEFLTWPHMDRFFGEEADRLRRTHLTESLLFLCYGVAVDHFQHLVYAEPEATPERRHQMWQQMEQLYTPWVDWGDLEYPASGGRWQMQRHIYARPFYYIDYTLALSCALQLWLRAERDLEGTMETYVALCERGGSAPFGELVALAELDSPFEPGSLEDVIARAEAELDL